MLQAGSAEDSFTVKRSAPADVAGYLAAADAGIAFRTPSFAMQAVAPVKVAEYLLCGLPVVGTAAIGDTRAAVDAGVFLNGSGGDAADWIMDRVLTTREDMRSIARRVGVDYYSLEQAVDNYDAALRGMTPRPAPNRQDPLARIMETAR